jgi:hypothetical protein
MDRRLLHGASITGALTLATTSAGGAGTIVTPGARVKRAIAGLVAICGMLAMLEGYRDSRDVAYSKGALEGRRDQQTAADGTQEVTLTAWRRLLTWCDSQSLI